MIHSDSLYSNSPNKKKPSEKDDFKESCQPLEEILDTVKDIEGFPLGEVEDILALSDPPYYTACPNPYLNQYIEWFGTPYDEAFDKYDVKPFVGDVSEGKNDPIYNAHSYHTKVPHKAIMRYILHYTKPGDIVFDGFCGTGMTGVAAQFCGDRNTIQELGYTIDKNDNVIDKDGNVVSKVGPRRAILNDLSPAATFIAYNYNTPVDAEEFEKEAKRILAEVEKECGWMYETIHTDGRKGKINYTVWSDVFICPYCGEEYVFWDVAVNKETGEVKKTYQCPNCKAEQGKRESEHAKITFFDTAIQEEVTQSKQVPVMINYSAGKQRFEKEPDTFDLNLIEKIEKSTIPYWFPKDRMMDGDEARRNDKFGITHVHHFYTKRNLWVLSCIKEKCSQSKIQNWFFNALLTNTSKMGRYGQRTGNVTGTLYVPSLIKDLNVLEYFIRKFDGPKGVLKPLKQLKNKTSFSFISTNSSTNFNTKVVNFIEYIFTDPPFGENLMYSELNFIWESWLKVWTNNKPEAIMNNVQQKGLSDYKQLMLDCFKEMYRVLKPNRWMTVEFHNSQASVWNAIQDAISKAGFIVAQVTVLDKQQGSFKQVTSSGAVKNDLVINAYKPKQQFEEAFLKRAGKNLEKEFVEEHLSHLPIEQNIERTEQMLYSKMLAHYVQHGFEIRFNSHQFYQMIRENFKLMDGYWFTDDQVILYDEWKKSSLLGLVKGLKQDQQTLFIYDEKSALLWLYQFLHEPRTYSDIYIAYQKAVSSIQDTIPELKELLNQNLIFEGEKYRRPLSEKELEALSQNRQRDLERDYQKYVAESKTTTKRLKDIRKEAVLQGFTKAYQDKQYDEIILVAKHLLPSILDENSEINDFVEIAKLKTGE